MKMLTAGSPHIGAVRIVLACVGCMVFLATLATAQETVVYSQGFESDDGGYVVDLGTTAGWQWGTPSGVGPGAAHSGIKCWGTNLAGTLNRTSEGSIISPAITLPTIAGNQLIRVRFWAYVAVDGMYDRCQFFVSKDKVNWESLIQLYHNMEVSPSLPSSWKKYEFTLAPSYAGGPIYLRFRAAVPYESTTFYCGGGGDLSGFYVDDVAITVFDTTGARKVFNLEAWEDQSTWASCPWVAPWNGSAFDVDNDIYSVARQPVGEYTDAYLLQKPLVIRNGVYPIEVQELESEDSFTDLVALAQVDHAPDVAVAPDNVGTLHGYRPAALLAPTSAVTGQGENVLGLVANEDGIGYPAYDSDTVALNFGTRDVSQGAVLVLRATGFVLGSGAERPYTGPPAIVVETRDAANIWQERGRFLPRYESAVAAFDLSPYLASAAPIAVRLRSISHSIKYHSIDFAALYVGTQPAFSVTAVAPQKATFGSENILPKLTAADGDRFAMSSGEAFALEFPVVPLAPGLARDFVFVSRGYYIPKSGSYLVYTWDGSDWVLRDSYSFPGSDITKPFDLSLFLPDPNGEYRVRVWQDYQYEPAGIDCVTMTEGGVDAPLDSAWDYRTASDIYSIVLTSDNVRTSWSSCPRNRVTEFNFTPPGTPNIPPTTCPVTVSGGNSPVISWTYGDTEGSAQALAEVEIWTGPGATGVNVWDPAVFTGTDTSVAYSGTELPTGTYYARVRANDGKDWGQWCEGSFAVAEAICGDLDHDGDVDVDDYLLMRGHYGKRAGQPGYIAEADYDGDGVGCLHDYATWFACYQAYLQQVKNPA